MKSQNKEKHKGFNHTTTSDDSEVAVQIDKFMGEAHFISFVVDDNGLYVEFDEEATSDSMPLKADDEYDERDVTVKHFISVKNKVPGSNATIRGMVWGA